MNSREVQKVLKPEDELSIIERTTILPYLMDLLFENLVETLHDLEYEQIYFEFWDFEMTTEEPSLDLFGPVEGDDGYLRRLAHLFKSYFRCQYED